MGRAVGTGLRPVHARCDPSLPFPRPRTPLKPSTHPLRFALCFSIGSALCVASTFALKGWRAQAAHVLSTERAPFTAGYAASLGATLYAAVGMHSYLLSLVCCSVQARGWEAGREAGARVARESAAGSGLALTLFLPSLRWWPWRITARPTSLGARRRCGRRCGWEWRRRGSALARPVRRPCGEE